MAFAVNPLTDDRVTWHSTVPNRDAFRALLVWAVVSLVLHLAWEVAQLPLYTIPSAQSGAQIAYAVVHCTAGDVLIAVASFVIAAAACRNIRWPESRPWRGGLSAILTGVSYTAYSEWQNVYQSGNWAYSEDMPLVAGIGLSPLLQWMFVPLMTILAVRGPIIRQPPH